MPRRTNSEHANNSRSETAEPPHGITNVLQRPHLGMYGSVGAISDDRPYRDSNCSLSYRLRLHSPWWLRE